MRRESDYEYFDGADFEQEDDDQEILDDFLIPEVDWAEDSENLLSSEKGMNELKERRRDTIEDIGPDAAEELADRM